MTLKEGSMVAAKEKGLVRSEGKEMLSCQAYPHRQG